MSTGPGWLTDDRRELLARLAAQRGVRRGPAGVTPRTGPDAPLSYAQRRLWFLDRLSGGSPVYHIAAGARLRGPLDVAALATALTTLVRRHEALRTVFPPGPDGIATQLPAAAPRLIELPAQPLAGTPAEVEQTALRLAREIAREPFDLPAGPPLRCRLLRLADDDHLLVVVLHHIVADGWSLDLLLRQLLDAYAEGAGGAQSESRSGLQLGDVACWEPGWLASAEAASQLDHWRAKLADAPLLELPTTRPRPLQPTSAGDTHRFSIEPRVAGRLAALAAEHRASPFLAALAGTAVVAGRWAGQDDVVLGTPHAGRHRPELAGVVGCLVNTLPLRLRLDPADRFVDLLEQARDTLLDAHQHSAVPFDLLVERLRPERDSGGRPPIVGHLISYEDRPVRRVRVGELEVRFFPVETGTAKFDLSVELATAPDGGLDGTVEYSTELFDPDTAVRFAAGLRTVLTHATADTRLADLPLLSPAERIEVVERFGSGGPPTEGSEATVHGLVEVAADRWPDQVAVRSGGHRLSYAELDTAANRLAHLLRARGIGPDRPVGVALPRGPYLLVALLGVLKAGGAYVPLDPEHPPARLAQIGADVAVPVVLTVARHRAAVTAAVPEGTPVLELDGAEVAADDLAQHRPEPVATPGDLAYVLHTSGSTGRPKGAMNTHRAVVNRLLWMQQAFGLQPGEAVLQKTPLGFDVSVWELFWPLLVGAQCVLAEPGAHRDPARLAATIAEHRVTTVHFVPSMLAGFLAAGAAADCGGALRRVVCSGEELPPSLVAACARELPGAAVFNLYGPTEAAVDVSWHRCRPEDGPRVPIGRPIAGVRLHVVDGHGQPVPVGVPGELLIAGVAVARGYWNRPAATAERFVPDVFGPPGARAYRTGDRVRWLPDGTLDYLGRLDRQVKIRGVRIEPGEIEATLADHADVASAVVDVRPGPDGAALLLAWVTCPDGATRAPELPAVLRAHLRDRLPAALLPATVTVLDGWPLNANGKLDRAALPVAAPTSPQAFVAPRDDTERAVAAIWAEVLDVDRVGAHDDFFALGGHSIVAVRILTRVRTVLGVEVALPVVFAAPTVAGMAAAVRAARADGGSAPAPPTIGRVSRERYRVTRPADPTDRRA
ncbi:non-ribosomal peptide synthetase [Micromonospora yangpuensis]|uniref:Amino acid adenylation domain-containing protein n=1 Tax=Micromonospora yangpuensis TaxID=683228 RepID=A0A1C6VGT1_9ACTN|nr:non-ribosomal peptide synthetase [Micromonospora yangpuensis]GGL99299.1 hypothetical protein GCM10012279_15830 [Micromonospora yangpuensis]SCL65553.1 amino acid adenylation domain-containing protein [Micromonospora yangpuensis]